MSSQTPQTSQSSGANVAASTNNAEPMAPPFWKPTPIDGGFVVLDRNQWHLDYQEMIVTKNACNFEGTYVEPVVLDIGAWTGEFVWWLESNARHRCLWPKIFCTQTLEEATKVLAHNLSTCRNNQGGSKTCGITISMGSVFDASWGIPHELVPNTTDQIFVWVPLAGPGFSASVIKPKQNLEKFRKVPSKILSPKSLSPSKILKVQSGGTEHLIIKDYLKNIESVAEKPDVVITYHWDLVQMEKISKLMRVSQYVLTKHELGPILDCGFMSFIRKDKVQKMMHRVIEDELLLQFN